MPLPLPTLEFTPSSVMDDSTVGAVGLGLSLDNNHNNNHNHSSSSSLNSDDYLDRELLDILSRVRLETLASRMGSGDERAGPLITHPLELPITHPLDLPITHPLDLPITHPLELRMTHPILSIFF